jgi:hypothetical protein
MSDKADKTKHIRVLRVCGKTSDMCSIVATNEAGEVIAERDGYVPKFFPGDHWGDYLQLNIDVKTGVILNWPKGLTQKALRAAMDFTTP